MKDEILEQIDKLKMMVMLDDRPKEPTESEKYDNWVAEMQGRNSCPNPYDISSMFIPTTYAKYKTLISFVDQLYKDKYGNGREYAKRKDEIRRMISVIVAMTMFYQEQGAWVFQV
jgi:hypothetical protein